MVNLNGNPPLEEEQPTTFESLDALADCIAIDNPFGPLADWVYEALALGTDQLQG